MGILKGIFAMRTQASTRAVFSAIRQTTARPFGSAAYTGARRTLANKNVGIHPRNLVAPLSSVKVGRIAAMATEGSSVKSFFDLSAKDIDGNMVDFAKFKGQVALVVNVATF